MISKTEELRNTLDIIKEEKYNLQLELSRLKNNLFISITRGMPAVMIDNLICRHPLKSFIIPTFIIFHIANFVL